MTRLAIILAALATLAGCAPSTGSGPAAPLDVQGHRGCRGLLPENSLPAFRHAVELGVTTLELDLQVTRDRILVVHHDQWLDPGRCRMADGSPRHGDA